MLYLNVGYRVPFNWTVLYIYSYLYKSFVCCMTLIISTVGRCNLSICAIDRLIVQVPQIVKESGMCTLFIVLPFSGTFSLFKVLPFSCFQIWDWAQCQSRLFSSVELFWNWLRDLSDMWEVEMMNLSWFRRRDLNDEWKTWHAYLYYWF